MRNLKPVHILLGGSAIIGALTFVLFIILHNVWDALELWMVFIIPFIIAFISFWSFYYFVKVFITEKLRILYRSIRKGKFDTTTDTSINVLDDVIERAEIETKMWTDERNAEISKLKEQEEFRREFLGNLAHELKTPVFSIQGYILTLLEGGLEDENVNRSFLERASKATERMTDILEDLDQITRMEVDKIILDITHFDIKELVDDVFEELEIKARKKHIELKFAKDFDPIFVQADRGKIGQVITNLLGNSITYGNDGGHAIVRFYIMDDIVTIEISDNGPGISEEDIPRLFERFYRVEKSRDRHKGGSGLGLAISKHIIEAHNQTISVRSTLDIGSTFTFGLDIGKSNRA